MQAVEARTAQARLSRRTFDDLATAPSLRTNNRISYGTSHRDLCRIASPDLEQVQVYRPVPYGLREWLSSLPNLQQIAAHFVTTANAALPCFEQLVANARIAPCALSRFLVEDMTSLVMHFAAISGSRSVDVRFEVITDDGCTRFHRDFVDLRLLTTYLGPGTQWIDPEHAADALALQHDYEGPIEEFPFGTIAIFKGGKSMPCRGLVHRSPKIAGMGVTRLLFCLNVPSSTSPAPRLS
jgi:hypothetical protein